MNARISFMYFYHYIYGEWFDTSIQFCLINFDVAKSLKLCKNVQNKAIKEEKQHQQLTLNVDRLKAFFLKKKNH